MKQRIFNAVAWLFAGVVAVFALAGCAPKVVTRTQTLVVTLPSELFVCKTHLGGRAKSHAEVLERYAKAVEAYSSCKRAVAVLKKANEELRDGKY